MSEGTIKMFREPQGYGFIRREGESDIFFHRSDILGEYFPRVDDKVSFDVENQPDGKFKALNVKPIPEDEE